jgi:abortive infection bacteriophage resistance protein
MSNFDKPSLTPDKHIEKLRDERGLQIPDAARAGHYLANISYFRLSAYTRPFYDPNQPQHKFLTGVQFEDILTLYVFDRNCAWY